MPHPIRAIIVDDEPLSMLRLDAQLAANCPAIRVVARGTDLAEARQIIHSCSFDVAFFDVELQDHSIFELLDEPTQFDVVLVTAYDSYAIRAVRTAVTDYILKPFSDKDIAACYNRLLARRSKSLPPQTAPVQHPGELAKIMLRAGEQVYVVLHSDIIYLKAHGAYTEVLFCYGKEQRRVVIGKCIHALTKICTAPFFYQVHKSYVVNTRFIKSLLKKDALQLIMTNDDVVPISKRRSAAFLQSCAQLQA